MNELEQRILEAQDAYYNGEPIMSDAEFDKLWDELKRKFPDSELLTKVGADHIDGFQKAQHLMLMGSQNKANTAYEMDKFFKKGQSYVASLKLDGISIELQYQNGRFIKGVTRGDGEIGDDITENVRKMKYVPLIIDEAFTGAVRGEILLFKSDKEKYFPEAKNCRNQASGLAKRKDGKGCEHLSVLCYDALSIDENREWRTETMICNYLLANGFKVSPFVERSDWDGDKAIGYIHDTWADLSQIDFDIDGIVFKQNIIDWNDKKTSYRPATQIALKPARDEAVTTVTGIEWRMTNGTLTPVIQVSPVELNGTTVSQASGYNAKQLELLDLEIGDTVSVVKAGMIIPKIVENISKDKRVKDY